MRNIDKKILRGIFEKRINKKMKKEAALKNLKNLLMKLSG
jgi:hypothetical protein